MERNAQPSPQLPPAVAGARPQRRRQRRRGHVSAPPSPLLPPVVVASQPIGTDRDSEDAHLGGGGPRRLIDAPPLEQLPGPSTASRLQAKQVWRLMEGSRFLAVRSSPFPPTSRSGGVCLDLAPGDRIPAAGI